MHGLRHRSPVLSQSEDQNRTHPALTFVHLMSTQVRASDLRTTRSAHCSDPQIATRTRIQSTGRSEDHPGLRIKHSNLRHEHPVHTTSIQICTTSTQIRAARERPWRSLPRFTCARELLCVRPRVRPSVRTGVTRKWPVPRNQVTFQVAPGGRPGSWWVWGVACLGRRVGS